MRLFTLLLSLFFLVPATVQSASYPAGLDVIFASAEPKTASSKPPGDLDEMMTNVQKAAKLSLTLVLLSLLAIAVGYGLLFLSIGLISPGLALLGIMVLVGAGALSVAGLVFLILGWVAMLMLKSKLDTIGDPSLTEEYMLKTRNARIILIVMSALFILNMVASAISSLLVQ